MSSVIEFFNEMEIKRTPSGKPILVSGLPFWKYSIPEHADFLREVSLMMLGGITSSEHAIARGEQLNQALQSAFNEYFRIMQLEDWFDWAYIHFDNERREATFIFRLGKLSRQFIIDYYAVLHFASGFYTEFRNSRHLLGVKGDSFSQLITL